MSDHLIIPPRIRRQQEITSIVVQMRRQGIQTTATEVETFLMNENTEEGRDFLAANFRPEFVEAMINRDDPHTPVSSEAENPDPEDREPCMVNWRGVWCRKPYGHDGPHTEGSTPPPGTVPTAPPADTTGE